MSINSLLGCALLGLSAAPAFAQNAGVTAPPNLHAVRLWVAGRTVPLHVSAQTDGQETYIPLTALEAADAQFTLISNGFAVHVTGPSRRAEDIRLVEVKGIGMIPLSALARVVDGVVESAATQSGSRPNFRDAGTVYLLARITDARFERGMLHVRTGFPVPSHTRMLAGTNPARGYVDFVGAEVADGFRPATVRDPANAILRLVAGQNSPTTRADRRGTGGRRCPAERRLVQHDGRDGDGVLEIWRATQSGRPQIVRQPDAARADADPAGRIRPAPCL